MFAKEKDDEELWEDLITYSLDKPGMKCQYFEILMLLLYKVILNYV